MDSRIVRRCCVKAYTPWEWHKLIPRVFRVLRPSCPLDSSSEIDGAALEGLVFQHLRAWISYRGSSDNLYFWRTRSGVEVDLVVYGPDTFCACEVKNTDKIHSKMLKGLVNFKHDYPEAEAYFMYRDKKSLMIKDIHCIPCEEFLLQLRPERSMR